MIPMQMIQMLNQFKQNPMQFLMQRGMSVPQGMNDPNQILQYLLNNGRISQQQVNQAVQMARQFENIR